MARLRSTARTVHRQRHRWSRCPARVRATTRAGHAAVNIGAARAFFPAVLLAPPEPVCPPEPVAPPPATPPEPLLPAVLLAPPEPWPAVLVLPPEPVCPPEPVAPPPATPPEPVFASRVACATRALASGAGATARATGPSPGRRAPARTTIAPAGGIGRTSDAKRHGGDRECAQNARGSHWYLRVGHRTLTLRYRVFFRMRFGE